MQRVLIDAAFIVFSIIFAVVIQKTGLVDNLIEWLGNLKYLGIFLAGMLFTSIFTTATSIVILINLAETVNPLVLGLIGGMGAVLGDYILFRFMRDTILDDVKYLASFARENRFSTIFKTRLFRFFLPFLGAVILASPFPDELAITLFSMSKINSRLFLGISYIFNSAGILLIGLLGGVIV
jgi:hypothetical protein